MHGPPKPQGHTKMTLYLLFTNWVQGPYQEIQVQGFHTARACEGCLENQGLVFPGMARAPS